MRKINSFIMENTIKITIIGLIIGYLLFKFLNKKQKNESYSEFLRDDKYKVKGQWDKD